MQKLEINFLKFKEKASLLFNNKYDYSESVYCGNFEKIKIICPIHGYFYKSPSNHTKKNHPQGCLKCSRELLSFNKTLNFDCFVKKASIIHNNKYIYHKNFYPLKERIKITCPIHGDFFQYRNSHLSGCGCKRCACKAANSKKIMNFENFQLLANLKHNNKYKYIEKSYVKLSSKISIICPEHGNFQQKCQKHLKGQGCPKCAIENQGKDKRLGWNSFIEKANYIHKNKYKYNITNPYTNSNDSINIKCPIHGDFFQCISSHLQGRGCSKCGASFSQSEEYICSFLKKNNIEYIPRSRKIIKNLELDIYIPSKNIAIECNGIYWHSELQGKDKNYHLNKTKLCSDSGIRLIHIWDTEIINKSKIVLSRLKSILNINKYSIYARKCEVREISCNIKNIFLNKYHIQGQDYGAKINLGLFYKNRLVAVMNFGKLRKALGQTNQNNYWELMRFTTIHNFNIVGGASKLLKYFQRNYNPNSIISYADKRWSNGNLYEKLNFKYISTSKPNYWYFNRAYILKHRFGFRKSELKKKLPIYNCNISEWENMKINNWNRIWDCGNLKYLWQIT